jgi:cell division transport system permease protein
MNVARGLISTERIVKYGVVNFGRNIWLAIAAIAMMSITLTILLFAIVANSTFRHTITDITSHIDVSFYLKDDVKPQARNALITDLKQLKNVKSVAYLSKAQALKIYQGQNANNKELLTAIAETDNPLPASLTIKPNDPNKLQEIRDFLSQPKVVVLQSENSNFGDDRKNAIDKITRATHFFEQAGVVGIVIFVIISMLIIFNTIRMAIFNRRDELVIMRLLGASSWFIRGPFVVETMMYGVVAAAISLIVCWGLFAVASSTLQASSLGLLDIGYSSKYFNSHLWVIILAQMGVGIMIGAVSSIVATRRYLKANK